MNVSKRMIAVLACLVIFSGVIFAENNVQFKTDTIKANYMIDGALVKQLIFSIENTSDENIWLLFENDKSKSNHDLIFERYLIKPENGDYRLFNLMLDGNVIWGDWIFDIYTYFLKIINPHESFHVIITYDDEISAKDLIDKIRLIPTPELIKIKKCLTAIDSDLDPIYKPTCISINLK